MRDVPTSMTNGWLATAKTGSRRPVVRATVQHQRLYRFQYDTAYQQGSDVAVKDDNSKEQHRAGHFSSLIFGENEPYREIPNLISFSWDRALTQDIATASLTLLNTEVIPIGDVATAADALDQAGFLTYNHGDVPSNARWGQRANGWTGILVPDAIIKTYEGYGTDPTAAPAQDPYLMQSGVWKIDTVTYNDDGSITIAMRDLGSILLDTVVFPPVIPFAEYPLAWVKFHQDEQKSRDCVGGHWRDHLRDAGVASSSNDSYVSTRLAFTNAPYSSYVDPDGGVEGHLPIHAISTHRRDTPEAIAHDEATFWRSTGQDEYDSMVWWQFDATDPMPVGALRISPHGGPYRVYISIHNGTKWLGTKTIPYEVNGVPGSPGNRNIHADIPFVTSIIADRFFAQDWTLPRVYNAAKIRLTFTRLRQKEVGEHPFRASLREFQIYTADTTGDLTMQPGTVMRLVGNYGDYTHIIKWICAWAGWYWPPHNTDQDFIRVQGGSGSGKDYVSFNEPDPVLPKGRVWGDFMKTGTAGTVAGDLTQDLFDKKPLMDVISYVRDIVGFLFYIDETGGVVWRAPNIGLGGKPRLGNYLSPAFFGDGRPGKRGRGGRTSEIVTLDDETMVLNYGTTLDSKNVRERVFIANPTGVPIKVDGRTVSPGKVGAVVKGFNPFPIGLLRIAIWTDQHFATKREARIMADLIVAQQMFSYKTARVTIPGYPKIQVDDQVRIFERVTSETFYHHVLGIHSEINMADGSWTYDLTTHWLGEDPHTAWVVKAEELHDVTQQYMSAIGYEPKDAEDNDDNATWTPGPGSS